MKRYEIAIRLTERDDERAKETFDDLLDCLSGGRYAADAPGIDDAELKDVTGPEPKVIANG